MADDEWNVVSSKDRKKNVAGQRISQQSTAAVAGSSGNGTGRGSGCQRGTSNRGLGRGRGRGKGDGNHDDTPGCGRGRGDVSHDINSRKGKGRGRGWIPPSSNAQLSSSPAGVLQNVPPPGTSDPQSSSPRKMAWGLVQPQPAVSSHEENGRSQTLMVEHVDDIDRVTDSLDQTRLAVSERGDEQTAEQPKDASAASAKGGGDGTVVMGPFKKCIPVKPGRLGQPIRCKVNLFLLKIPDELTVFQYDVVMLKNGTERTLNRVDSSIIFWKIIHENISDFGSEMNVVYDDQKIMFSIRNYQWAEDGRFFTTRAQLERDLLHGEQEYTVIVKYAAVVGCSHADFRRVFTENHQNRETQCLQFLQVLLRQGRMFNDSLIPSGRSFFNRGDAFDLGCGRKLLRGFYASSRLVDGWAVVINLDMTATGFYEELNLLEFCKKVLKIPHMPTKLNDYQTRILNDELKVMKLKAEHIGHTFPCRGLHQKLTARTHRFDWIENNNNHGKVSVEEYFMTHYNIKLNYPDLPLVIRSTGPNARYFPLECCRVAKNQRVPRGKLSENTDQIIKKAAVPPFERKRLIEEMLVQNAQYQNDDRLSGMRISASLRMMDAPGRIIDAPSIKYSGQRVIKPKDGSWNLTADRFVKGAVINNWIVLVLDQRMDYEKVNYFTEELVKSGKSKGITFNSPRPQTFEVVRHIDQFESVARAEWSKFATATGNSLDLLLVILPDREKHFHPEVKRVTECCLDLVSQCVKAGRVMNVWQGKNRPDQLLANICMKINVKLGGVNSIIANNEENKNHPDKKTAVQYLYTPILFIGADVTHPDPGDGASPSIAGIASSMDNHPNEYLGQEFIQENRMEMIGEFREAVRKALLAYLNKSRCKPEKIVIYRDGVSEGQFEEVLRKELAAVQQACLSMDGGKYKPGITYIIVQKRHHTRIFRENINPNDKPAKQNIPSGTVVDTTATQPDEFNFYLASQQGIQGTTKPAHYRVLWDDNGFTQDALQSLTYFLCHTYSRCTRSVSIPAPCYYAHHIAFRARNRLTGILNNKIANGTQRSPKDAGTVYDMDELKEWMQMLPNIKLTMYWQ